MISPSGAKMRHSPWENFVGPFRRNGGPRMNGRSPLFSSAPSHASTFDFRGHQRPSPFLIEQAHSSDQVARGPLGLVKLLGQVALRFPIQLGSGQLLLESIEQAREAARQRFNFVLPKKGPLDVLDGV